MVDELMLRDVNNILRKIEVVRSREDFDDFLLSCGLTKESNEEEINEAIVSGYMGEKELVLYKRFVLYRKKQDLNNLVVTIDSLNELTSTVSDNYEERAECIRISNLIRGEISKVDACLRDVPNIRVSSAYNSVKIDYRKYFDAYIKSGMDRATYTEGIDKIQRSGIVIRGLKSRKLKQLKQGLKEHNVSSKENVEYLYNQYIDTRDKYGSYLREVMADLLNKHKDLLNAALLSLNTVFGLEVPIITKDSGVKAVDFSKEIPYDTEFIAAKIFEYFQKLDIPDFDHSVFTESFRNFLLSFYNNELEMLSKKEAKALTNIRSVFDKQKSLMGGLVLYKESVDLAKEDEERDVADTFALVYASKRNNN